MTWLAAAFDGKSVVKRTVSNGSAPSHSDATTTSKSQSSSSSTMEALSLPPPALGEGEGKGGTAADSVEGAERGGETGTAGLSEKAAGNGSEADEGSEVKEGLDFPGEMRCYRAIAVVSFVEGQSASGCDDGHLVLHAKIPKGYCQRKDGAPSDDPGSRKVEGRWCVKQ